MKVESTEKPKAFTIKYKRPRGSRACVVCRSRKVRCDAEIHVPCTNCITFGCECTLPEAKKRGNSSNDNRAKRKQPQADDNEFENGYHNSTNTNNNIGGGGGGGGNHIGNSNNNNNNDNHLTNNNNNNNNNNHINNINNLNNKNSIANSKGAPSGNVGGTGGNGSLSSATTNTTSGGETSEPVLNISQLSVPPSLTSNYKNRPSMHKKELLSSNGKALLTFLGSSSIGLFAQRLGQNHVELTEDLFDIGDTSLDSVELEILKLRGAFLLPPKDLSLDLIESYFEHVHPLMPVINRTEFMKKFKDPNDQPSLMLLQAVLLCGSRISKNPLLLDSKGSTNIASLTFFRRAKALYEANYESDPVSLIQTLILIGSFWEGPEDVTKNSFYWTRVAVGLAQGFGFQRDVSTSPKLLDVDKKIWRRIWWCLFEKDRNVAIAFGRPSVIDLNDCDVPMLTIEDFNEEEGSPYPVNHIQALYFIHLVKLAEITGIIVKHQYTVKAELMKRKNKSPIIQHCDMLMGIWFTNLPPQLVFSLLDKSTQNFYSCLLNAQYYNRLYLIHRLNLLRMAKSNSTNPNNYKYPSWGISFQAARMISIVLKNLLDRDQIKYCPVMFVYILFSALMMIIYHVDSPNNVIASTASDSLFVSRAVLREMGKYWPIAGVLLKLFDKYGNDKSKRAKIIENATHFEEYQEFEATKKELDDQQNINSYYTRNTSHTSDSPQLNVSGISPGGNVYKDQHLQNIQFQQRAQVQKQIQLQQHQQQQHQQQHQQSVRQQLQQEQLAHQEQFHSKPLEELVQQFKQPPRPGGSSTNPKNTGSSKTDTSPTSSNRSFPDISLVTENIPTNTNFFENFEPTQLFPEARGQSYPASRAESPSNMQSLLNDSNSQSPMETNSMAYNNESTLNNGGEEDDSEVVVDTLGQHLPPTTPGGGMNTNFMDSSFINMNLQSNYLNEDLGAFFNYQIRQWKKYIYLFDVHVDPHTPLGAYVEYSA